MKMKCDKCNKSFEHELSFKVHRDYCHSDKKCKQCHKQFTNLKTLRRHVISIHEKALIYECDVCDSKFSVQNKLHLHKLKEHENVEFKCANCSKKFAHTTNLKKHLEKCKPEAPSKLSYQCDLCHRAFRFELTLKHHKQICQKGKNGGKNPVSQKLNLSQNGSSKDQKKKSKENILQNVTNVTNSREKSSRKVTKKQNSKDIKKAASQNNVKKPPQKSPAKIKKKRQSVTNGPVKCQTCSNIFDSKHQLYFHEEKEHNFIRKFSCVGCDSKFDVKKKYSEHLNKIHDHKCDTCSVKFGDKQAYIDHFETGMCESATMAKFNDNLLTYCDICHISFIGAESLEKHVLQFHLNKVNQRDICDTMVNLGIIPEVDAFMAYLGLQRVTHYI